jgi:hypothetical protein
MTLTTTSPDICAPRSHAAKRVSILEAATYVFCREGYAGANIDMIAAEAAATANICANSSRRRGSAIPNSSRRGARMDRARHGRRLQRGSHVSPMQDISM